MSELSEFGQWLRDERKEHTEAYLASGGEISPFYEGNGSFGAYRRTTQWFRNLFVDPKSGAPNMGWGEGWAADVTQNPDQQRLTVYLSWLDGYIENWGPESNFEKAFPEIADPEKYRTAIGIKDHFLEMFPHVRSQSQTASPSLS